MCQLDDPPALLAGVDVVITGDTTVRVNDAIAPKSLTLSGKARLVPAKTTTKTENGLPITTDSVTIGPEASIDLTGRGYLGGYQPGNSSQGDTLGLANGSSSRSGGSHAMRGAGPAASSGFGEPFEPTTLGGGGGAGTISADGGDGGVGADTNGGSGGRIALDYTTLTSPTLIVNGSVLANGGDTALGQVAAGAGAGGAIKLTTDVFSGSGTLRPASGLLFPPGTSSPPTRRQTPRGPPGPCCSPA